MPIPHYHDWRVILVKSLTPSPDSESPCKGAEETLQAFNRDYSLHGDLFNDFEVAEALGCKVEDLNGWRNGRALLVAHRLERAGFGLFEVEIEDLLDKRFTSHSEAVSRLRQPS